MIIFLIDTLSSASNYGEYWFIRNAKCQVHAEQASMRFNFSSSFPYEFTTLTATPFSWLETYIQIYVEIKNRALWPFFIQW